MVSKLSVALHSDVQAKYREYCTVYSTFGDWDTVTYYDAKQVSVI
jgi:hypothetical protein